MTKEFMKEKFEQKHVHWAPETFEIHASKRANKPSIKLENGDEENCVCKRQKCWVICRICGSYMSSARIRKNCSIHPSIDLAEDISQCRFRLVTLTDSDFAVSKSYLPPPSVLNSDFYNFILDFRPCQAPSEDLKEITQEFINEKLLKHAQPAPETFQNIIKEVKCEGIDEVESIKKEIKVENDTPPSKLVQNRVNLGNSNAKTQIGKPNPVIPGVSWYQHNQREGIDVTDRQGFDEFGKPNPKEVLNRVNLVISNAKTQIGMLNRVIPGVPWYQHDQREGIDEVVSIKKEIKVENDTTPSKIGKRNPVIPGVPWYKHDQRMSAPPEYYYGREKLLSLAENTSNSRNFPKFQEVKQTFPEILLEEKRTQVVPILEVNKNRVGKINITRREYWVKLIF